MFGFSETRDRQNQVLFFDLKNFKRPNQVLMASPKVGINQISISFKKEPLPKVKGATMKSCKTNFYPAFMGYISRMFSLATNVQPIILRVILT